MTPDASRQRLRAILDIYKFGKRDAACALALLVDLYDLRAAIYDSFPRSRDVLRDLEQALGVAWDRRRTALAAAIASAVDGPVSEPTPRRRSSYGVVDSAVVVLIRRQYQDTPRHERWGMQKRLAEQNGLSSSQVSRILADKYYREAA